MDDMKLGRFGHHPDPAIDYLVEIEEIESMAENRRVGFDQEPELERRVSLALDFNVGGDENCVVAKRALHVVAGELENKR